MEEGLQGQGGEDPSTGNPSLSTAAGSLPLGQRAAVAVPLGRWGKVTCAQGICSSFSQQALGGSDKVRGRGIGKIVFVWMLKDQELQDLDARKQGVGGGGSGLVAGSKGGQWEERQPVERVQGPRKRSTCPLEQQGTGAGL